MTQIEARTLRYIDAYQASHHGATPSFEDIRDHLRVGSTSDVEEIVISLGKQGCITRHGPFWRSIRIGRMPAVGEAA